MPKEHLSRQLLAQAASRLDLPTDLVAGLPRMELTGFGQLAVEGHCGILEYGTERIAVAVRPGRLVIEGRDLAIRSMDHSQLLLTGQIAALRLEGTDG